jgi:hypothetical protein
MYRIIKDFEGLKIIFEGLRTANCKFFSCMRHTVTEWTIISSKNFILILQWLKNSPRHVNRKDERNFIEMIKEIVKSDSVTIEDGCQCCHFWRLKCDLNSFSSYFVGPQGK